MRILAPVKVLSVIAVLLVFNGCAGGTAIESRESAAAKHVYSPMGRIPAAIGPIGMLKVHPSTGRKFASFDACPPTGTLIYVSDFNNSVVSAYAGPNFTGQAPCAQITSANGLVNPQGMFVKAGILYIANTGANETYAFRRNHLLHPFKLYVDPSGQYPVDVTVTADDTVISSNIFSVDGSEAGSISTFNKNTRAFLNNYPMPNSLEGLFLTVDATNHLFFNDIDASSGAGVLQTGVCNVGVCGAFSVVGGSTNTAFPGGLRSTRNDTRLDQIDQSGGPSFNDFKRPGFALVRTCNIPGASDAVGDDLNFTQRHLFWADAGSNNAGEMTYPQCVLKGNVAGNASGLPIGVAVDRGDPLK